MTGITYTIIDCDDYDATQIANAIKTIEKIESIIDEYGNEDAPPCFHETVMMLHAIINGDFRC